MKRLLPLLLCILILVGMLPTAALAAELEFAEAQAPDQAEDIADVEILMADKSENAQTGAEIDAAKTGWKLLTEAQFQAKMAEVQQKYPDGGVFSGYYYENGYVKAYTCWAYAAQMLYEFFGAQFYNDGLYSTADHDKSDLESRLCAGDWVRIDMWGGNPYDGTHSIFLTKIAAEGVYYTDGNGDGANGISWKGFYSWSQLYNNYCYRVHLPGNTLKGGDVTHTVVYDSNGGGDDIRSVTYRMNEEFVVEGCGCSMAGAQFAGYTAKRSDNKWLTTDAGWQAQKDIYDNGYTYAVYQPGERVSMDSAWLGGVTDATTFTLYAQWLSDISTVELLNNYSGYNYLLGSDLGSGYSSYINSRNANVYTLSVDTNERYNNQPSLKVVGKTAGASGKDLELRTSTNAGYGDGFTVSGVQGDNKDMTLRLNIKSETDGAAFKIRWGFQSTSAYTSVTLSKGWKTYTISLPKNVYFGSSLHPYFDKAGTYYINSMSLTDGSSNTAITPESGGRAAYTLTVTRGGAIGTLPVPVRDGYTFLGWYTAAEGGDEVTEKTAVIAQSLRLYAHWSKDVSYVPVNTVVSNDHVYELYDNAMSWEDAKRFCEEQGGHLLTVDSFYENNVAYQMISDRTGFCWLGLSYDTGDKAWEWVTGETYFFNYWYNSSYGTADDGKKYAIMYPMNLNGTAYAAKWDRAADDESNRNYYGRSNSFFICEYDYNGFVGDADGSGDVNEIDVTVIQRYHSNLVTNLSDETLMFGDVDGSGALDITDATFIQRWLAEMETPYAIGKRKG